MKAVIFWVLIATFPNQKTAVSLHPFETQKDCKKVVKQFEQFKGKIKYSCELKCDGDKEICKEILKIN